MKFGVILPNYGPQAGRLAVLDTALAAESLGFDSVWTTDHFAQPESDGPTYVPILEAVSTLAYLAASTGTVRLGISALVLPQRNPVEMAKVLATIDALSGGRLVVAVGIGWSKGEYANLGYDFTNRGKRMDEAIRVLRTLWRGGRIVSFKGQYYRFERLQFAPPPVQAGGPPLWTAGNSPRALRRAALLADGWHPVGLTAGELGDRLQVARPFLAGRPFEVAPRLTVALNSEPPEGVALGGGVDAVAHGLRAYRQAGATYAVLHFLAESQPERERAMRLFAREVMPQLEG